MATQFAKAPYSVHWKDWLLSHIFPAEFSSQFQTTNIEGYLNSSTFNETYEIDGVDISDGSYTLASEKHEYNINIDGNIHNFTYDQDSKKYFGSDQSSSTLGWRLGFTNVLMKFLTLMGLPTRPNAVLHHERSTENANFHQEFFLIILKQFGKNLIGGWDSDPNISKEKKFWQWVSLPFKIFIILPWKLISFPFKLLINGAKVLTEWVPSLHASLFAVILGAYRSTRFGKAQFPDSKYWKRNPLGALGDTLLVALLRVPHLLLGTLYFAFRLVALIGRTITSPLKSARMAFRFGRELKVTLFGESEWGEFFNRLTSNSIGVLGLTISMSMTAVFWVIMLPSAVVSAVSYLCIQYPWTFELFTLISQLPPVVAAVSWFTPMLTATFAFLNPLGIVLTQVFGTAIASFSAFVGLQLSMAYTITGSALALIATPVALALTHIGEVLSNIWVTWVNGGPVTSALAKVKSCFAPINQSSNKGDFEEAPKQVQNPEGASAVSSEGDFSPSTDATELYELAEDTQKGVKSALLGAQSSAIATEGPYQRTQEGKLPSTPDFAELYRKEKEESLYPEKYIEALQSL